MNRCPTVKAYEERLRALQDEFGLRGVQIVKINSDDPHLYPDESDDRMVELAPAERLQHRLPQHPECDDPSL
jgi:hypothetical protein